MHIFSWRRYSSTRLYIPIQMPATAIARAATAAMLDAPVCLCVCAYVCLVAHQTLLHIVVYSSFALIAILLRYIDMGRYGHAPATACSIHNDTHVVYYNSISSTTWCAVLQATQPKPTPPSITRGTMVQSRKKLHAHTHTHRTKQYSIFINHLVQRFCNALLFA